MTIGRDIARLRRALEETAPRGERTAESLTRAERAEIFGPEPSPEEKDPERLSARIQAWGERRDADERAEIAREDAEYSMAAPRRRAEIDAARAARAERAREHAADEAERARDPEGWFERKRAEITALLDEWRRARIRDWQERKERERLHRRGF